MILLGILVAILVVAGPIVGAIALLLRGEWPTVVIGFGAMVAMKYIYLIALLPNLAIGAAASRLREGSSRPGPVATSFMVVWQALCLLLYPCLAAYCFMIHLGSDWTWPHVLFALGVAFMPVMFLAMKDYGNPASLTGPIVALLAWATATVVVFVGAGSQAMLYALLGLVAVSVALVGLNVYASRED